MLETGVKDKIIEQNIVLMFLRIRVLGTLSQKTGAQTKYTFFLLCYTRQEGNKTRGWAIHRGCQLQGLHTDSFIKIVFTPAYLLSFEYTHEDGGYGNFRICFAGPH